MMLTINPQQLAAYTAIADEALVASIVTFLREELSEEADEISPPDLTAMARECAARASTLGIEGVREIHRLAGFMLLFGAAFETHPDFAAEHETFHAAHLPWWYKFDRLQRCLSVEE